MIDLRGDAFLSQHVCGIGSTSYDDANDCRMLDDSTPVVNMDAVTKAYASKLEMVSGVDHIEVPPSVDALHISKDGAVTLVEFKNGKVKFTKVRDKVCHTLLILGDIGSFGMADARKEISFVLVYNESAMPGGEHGAETGDEGEDARRRVQAAPERAKIGSGLNRKARIVRHFKPMGEMLEGYCCKSVLTYTPEEFERLFLSNAALIGGATSLPAK